MCMKKANVQVETLPVPGTLRLPGSSSAVGFHNGAPLQIASPRILQLEKVEKGISYMNIEH